MGISILFMYLSKLSLLFFFLALHGAYTKPTNFCNLKPSYLEHKLKQYQDFKEEFKLLKAFFKDENNLQTYIMASEDKDLLVQNEKYPEFNLAKALFELDGEYCLKRSMTNYINSEGENFIKELQAGFRKFYEYEYIKHPADYKYCISRLVKTCLHMY